MNAINNIRDLLEEIGHPKRLHIFTGIGLLSFIAFYTQAFMLGNLKAAFNEFWGISLLAVCCISPLLTDLLSVNLNPSKKHETEILKLSKRFKTTESKILIAFIASPALLTMCILYIIGLTNESLKITPLLIVPIFPVIADYFTNFRTLE